MSEETKPNTSTAREEMPSILVWNLLVVLAVVVVVALVVIAFAWVRVRRKRREDPRGFRRAS